MSRPALRDLFCFLQGKRNGFSAVRFLAFAIISLSPGLASAQAWQAGFDFRNTATFVTDPPGDTYVLSSTTYPTTVNGVTFGWTTPSLVQARDRSTAVDPRLAGINYANNGSPATFYVDLPAPGTYNLSLAMGDEGYPACYTQCQVQFLDGTTLLATVTEGMTGAGYFYDATGRNWSAATWPGSNINRQVTLAGSRLTVVVGASNNNGDLTPIAFLGVTQQLPGFNLSASPASLTIQQGNQGTSTITTTISGQFNSAIALSASGVPSGTTVNFNPNPILAPGSGNSTMTITVGSGTTVGTYPITVSGNGGGFQQNAIVNLTVSAPGSWQAGFDFRNTSTYVADPPGDTYVLSTTAYPTNGNGVTYGWVNTSLVQARDRSTTVDPRLAGINYVNNGSPATFNVDLPSSGTYNLTLAMGDEGYPECYTQCQVQFLDGSTVLATVSGGTTNGGYFYDAEGKNWSAAAWPGSNLSQQVTLAGSRLTVVVGTSKSTGDLTPIAFLGVAQASSGSPNFAVSASPSSLTVQQGNQGTSTITTTISGGFNNAITLSASGAPSGTTVSFNPNPIPAPGSGNSTMTITVGVSTPVGTYPITVTGNGGGIQQNTTVTLTVTAQQQANFTISASPSSLTIQQGNQGTSTITTTISGGFNNAITLSASGTPSGTTVSFNPNPIPAPGSGNSTMTITVGASTPTGAYPITVTGNGGGIQQNTTVTLTVTGAANFTISASPSSLTIQQGNQGTSTITTTISGGFNSAISLSASGMPSGTTVSFNPNPIPAPGSGSSTMTVTVGASTPTGSYPITVTGNGGGIQQNTTVTLTVLSSSAWAIGFDFRASSNYVTDPPGDTYVLNTTAYPSSFNGITYGWTNVTLVQSRNRSTTVDPRLAGINYAMNGTPATFYLDLPASGTYSLSLAMGDESYPECGTQCQIQFLDGNTVVATIAKGSDNLGYFYDAQGNNWSAALWPTKNVSQQVAISGKRLTMVVGTNKSSGDLTPIAFLGVTEVTLAPNFLISASPTSLSVVQGNQGTSTITTYISGGFNGAISLSASGMPSGTTVSFNPNPIPAPGAGTSTMTVTVGNSTPPGTYPITVTANGDGVQQTATVAVTVIAAIQPNYVLAVVPPSVTVAQGSAGQTTASTSLVGRFNSAITLSASGLPSGITVTV